MKILIVSHTIKENKNKFLGRWSIIPYYLAKEGIEVRHIIRNEWAEIIRVYNYFEPDIVIGVGPIGAYLCLLKKIKIIKVKLVHDWNDNYGEVFSGFLNSKIAKSLEKYAVKNSDLVITPAYSRCERAKKWKTDMSKIHYLPHGVKDYFFKEYKKINLPGKNKIKLIYAGQLSRSKEVDKLILAMNNKDIDLILLGEINHNLKRIAAKNIYFLGAKKQEEVPNYLFSSDYLITTENNDSALKLMEYIKVGKPILAPFGRVDNLAKKCSLILQYDNINEIEKIILENKIKRKNKMKVLSWRDTVKEYIRIIKN